MPAVRAKERAKDEAQEKEVAHDKDKNGGKNGGANGGLDAATHRRILTFLNKAAIPEDLFSDRPVSLPGEMAMGHGMGGMAHGDDAPMGPTTGELEPLLEPKLAQRVLEARDEAFPLGFRNIAELEKLRIIPDKILDRIFDHFCHLFYGAWSVFPQPIPRRGPGSYAGVVHAALCHTGKVLFITADETTLLWDPTNTTPATYENPVNQPPYSQLCGHHVFLSNGQLLTMGGGGYGPNPVANRGFRFDPVAKTWTQTANPMSESKWYPTASVLDDSRVLVTCGNSNGQMDIYDETTDTFQPVVSGDTRHFPNLYPGLHVLPSGIVFYSRTGWGSAGANGFATADSTSAYFALTGPNTGVWTPITSALVNRAKGMSVLIYGESPPYVRVLVVGGVDNATNNTYELMDATVMSPGSAWSAPIAFPDGQHRSLCSAVLLPDGKVFILGGIQTPNSPCTMYDPEAGTWAPMAALPSIRDYHSVAILLPSGRVMMAGWNNSSIEIFDPPYMFQPRPTISGAPNVITRGQSFTISSPQAASIDRAVLVRPMAITHQTDASQRVLRMPCARHTGHGHSQKLILTAPGTGNPHAMAPKGYYMLFAINDKGVPSEARWVYLQ